MIANLNYFLSRIPSWKVGVIFFGGCLGSGSVAAQSVIDIDITSNPAIYNPSANGLSGVVGISSGVTWNAVNGTSPVVNLLDESGVTTGVSFQLTGNYVDTIAEGDQAGTFRISGTDPGFFQSQAFLSNTGNPGNVDSSTFTIGGLQPGSQADLYLYSTWKFQGGAEFRLSSDGGNTWSAWKLADGSPNSTTAPFSAGHSYVLFSAVTAHSDGSILGEWKTTLAGGSTRNRGAFNAVQIVANAILPPAQIEIQQALEFDSAGDLFLQLSSLPIGKTSIVQESADLEADNWTERFALTGLPSADLILSQEKPARFFRLKSVEAPKVVQPNIVLILAEDCSKHWFDLFDPTYGTSTPNIDVLANSGLIFDNAYCNVAVCSAARSTIMAGSDPSRIGVQWHRNISKVSLSNGQLTFPAYLKKAGYYTTNSTKTDYNLNVGDSWNNAAASEFGWRDRPNPTNSFLHVWTIYTSHESSIQTSGDIASPTTNPASVNLYPIHPDTTIFRKTFATYVDKIKSVDNEVGRIFTALQDDGVLDDTFIIFVGDNGGTMPGSKGTIANTGLHVPLVVYVPANWTQLAPAFPSGRVSGFVSFEDIGPTIKSLAGLGVPKEMDGKPFLGENVTAGEVNAGDTAFSATDRFDEMYNLIRSLQQGTFKYIRHYEPFYPNGLYSAYRYAMLSQQEWKQMYDANQLNAVQRQFFEPRKAEELYDMANDPFETNNLAANPAYAATVIDLRGKLQQRVKQMPDLGMVTEAVFLQEGGQNDSGNYGKVNQERIGRYVDIADLMLQPYASVAAELSTRLSSSDPLDRYWALTACASFGSDASALESTVTTLVGSESNSLVLARAAVFLGELGANPSTVESALHKAVLNASNSTFSLLVLNGAVHLQDTLGYTFTINASDVVGSSGFITNRIEHLGW